MPDEGSFTTIQDAKYENNLNILLGEDMNSRPDYVINDDGCMYVNMLPADYVIDTEVKCFSQGKVIWIITAHYCFNWIMLMIKE